MIPRLGTLALFTILLLSSFGFLSDRAIAETDSVSISATKNLSNDDEVSSYPQIAASDTNVYVVWESEIFKQETEGRFTEKSVLMRKGMDYGQHFKETINLAEVRSAEGKGPQWTDIAASLNNVLITWVNGSGVVYSENVMKSEDSTDVFLRSNSACGEGGFIKVNNISNSTGKSVSIPPHLDAFGGFVYLVWSEYTEDGTDLLFRRSTDFGLTFADVVSLNKETERKGVQSSFLIDTYAYLSNFYVVWTDYDAKGNKDLYLKKSLDYGETFEDVVTIRTVSDTVGGIDDPRVVASSDKAYVVWRDNNTPTGKFAIFLRTITDHGRNLGEIIDLSDISRESDSPQIAVYENNVYVIWEDYTDPENSEVFFRASTDGGKTFGDIINLSNNVGSSYHSQIAASDTTIYVVWHDQATGDGEILLAVSADNGATFRTVNLSNSRGWSDFPQIVANPYQGKAYVVWQDASIGNFDIFFRTITEKLSVVTRAPVLGEGLIITEVELNPPESDTRGQWIEVHNPTNSTIGTGALSIRQPECQSPSFFLTSIELQPKEHVVIEIWEKEYLNEGFPKVNTTLSLWVNKELFRTQPMTDTFSDSRTWQLEGKKWVFAEATPSRAIPEFPVVFAVLSASLMVFIILNRFASRRKIKLW